MQEQKDALALAETKRLAIGGHVSTGSDTMSVRGRGAPLFSVEVPASLRNKELVTFLQRKTVVDIFDQAHERCVHSLLSRRTRECKHTRDRRSCFVAHLHARIPGGSCSASP
jgi:hypothetical protein